MPWVGLHLQFLLFVCLAKWASGAVVKELTSAEFGDFVMKNDLVLVEFYAQWCGPCLQLAPDYETPAEELQGTGVILAKVDGAKETLLVERYNISGYPSFFVFRKGRLGPYDGGLSAKNFVNYMRKQLGPCASLPRCLFVALSLSLPTSLPPSSSRCPCPLPVHITICLSPSNVIVMTLSEARHLLTDGYALSFELRVSAHHTRTHGAGQTTQRKKILMSLSVSQPPSRCRLS